MGGRGRGGGLRLSMVDWPLRPDLLWLGRFGSARFEVGGYVFVGLWIPDEGSDLWRRDCGGDAVRWRSWLWRNRFYTLYNGINPCINCVLRRLG